MTSDVRWFVHAQITRWIDKDPQPGIVECRLTDVLGVEWTFISKFYDFTTTELWSDSTYPQAGYIACEIISHDRDASGRETAEIDTGQPFRGLESEEGVARFKVFSDLLVTDALPEPIVRLP